MTNEASVSATGYVATQPLAGFTRNGVATLSMRVGWTPRRMDKDTGDWADEPTSFATVKCYKKIALNAAACLRKGDPVVVKGSLRVREWVDQAGVKRPVVEILADSIGHDLTRGVSLFNKTPAHLAQTALEHQRAEAAAGRALLPGDRAEAEAAGDDGRAEDDDEGDDRVKPDGGDERDDRDEDDLFDEEEANEILSETTEPVPAPI